MLLKPIGRIRTPYHSLPECPGSAPLADGTSTIEIFANFADGLEGLGEADRTQLRSLTRIDKRVGGVFANRSPARPNPIGISAVRLLSVEGTVVVVGGLDCLDRTPLLDMKPYIPRLDRIERAAVDWMRT